MEGEAQLLANEYSKYLRIDASNNAKIFEDSINDTLSNLEEYGRIVDVMRSDSSVNMNAILYKKAELLSVFEKIRKLEIIVGIIKRNVDEMESLVINAETDLKITAEGKLRSFLKNVIFKKKNDASPNASPNRRNEIIFIQPNIFSTSELFNGTNSSI